MKKNNMPRRRKLKMQRVAAPIALVLLLITGAGCKPKEPQDSPTAAPYVSTELSGSITVYANSVYHPALEHSFRTLKTVYSNISISLEKDADKADVVISDKLPKQHSQFADLSQYEEKYSDILIPELVQKADDKALGLPLFLRSDNVWYDSLFYQKNEIKTPYSLTDFESSAKSLNADLSPIVYNPENVETLFWGNVAPFYLVNGGTAEELAAASFKKDALLPTFMQMKKLADEGNLIVTADSNALFRGNKAMFWFAGLTDIAEIRNSMPSNSRLNFCPTLLFPNNQRAAVVLRADSVFVKNSVDSELAGVFLHGLYENRAMINLATDSKIPLAAKITFGSNSVPEISKIIYNILSSPSLDVSYISCRWDSEQSEKILAVMTDFINGTITPAKTCEQLCSAGNK